MVNSAPLVPSEMSLQIKTPFGVREGHLIHVSEVERGLHRKVVCIHCGSMLVAKKGEKTTHHFAHHSESACDGMRVLHKLGQKLMRRRIEHAFKDGSGLPFQWDCKSCGKIHRRNLVKKARKVREEFTLKGAERNPRSDLVLFDSKDKPHVAVEIVVTHAPEDWVIETYRELGITRVEFSLNGPEDLELLANGETLKADKVDWCEMPKCECGSFFRPRVVHLVDADCWKCHSDMVIAYGTGLYNHIDPSKFTWAERKAAEGQGARFSILKVKRDRRGYLSNECSFCGWRTRNFDLHDYWGVDSDDLQISMECKCGRKRDFTRRSSSPLSEAGRTVMVDRSKKPRLRAYDLMDRIDFGKQFVGRTVEEMMKTDISYAKWCLENVAFFCVEPEEIRAWNESAETDARVGGKYRKMNFDKLDILKAEGV